MKLTTWFNKDVLLDELEVHWGIDEERIFALSAWNQKETSRALCWDQI